MKWLEEFMRMVQLSVTEIKVGTRVRVDEDKALGHFAYDLKGMDWGVVIEVDKNNEGFLVKPEGSTVPDDLLAGWVMEDAIVEAVNLQEGDNI